jgi:hypothetical protein
VNHPKIVTPAVLLGLVMALMLPVAAFGAEPETGAPSGQLEVDRTTTTKSPEQQARVNAKLDRAAQVAASVGDAARLAGSSKEGTFLVPGGEQWPPLSRILPTNFRQQKTSYWCGPASAQVAINYSRGYFYTQKGGENPDTNYRLQSEIAAWANTTASSGTSGANLENALNRPKAILKPTSDWIYIFSGHGDLDAFHNMVVTDIAEYGMPLISLVRPNEPGKAHRLSSWDGPAIHAGHWILLRGYSGLNPDSSAIFYDDSSEGYQGGTGAFSDPALTMWKVSHYHSDMIIW